MTNIDLIAWLAVASMVTIGPILVSCVLFRWRVRIAARPILESTREEHVLPFLRSFLAHVAPALVAQGFTPAASVYAARFGTTLRWTQVLFLHRAAGDRASVLCIQEGRFCSVELIFAAEFSGGSTVTTPNRAAALEDIDVHRLYEDHRKRVAETSVPGATRVLPAPGEEHSWLSGKAAAVAASIADRHGFRRDHTGDSYVLKWTTALRLAWRYSLICRVWYGLTRRPAPRSLILGAVAPATTRGRRGFDVRVAPPTVAGGGGE